MQNLKYVEVENEVLRLRLKSVRAAAEEFADLVTRYVEPHKGDPYCSRTEILNKKEELKRLLK